MFIKINKLQFLSIKYSTVSTCELFVRVQLVNYERKYKPIWSFALLTNYDGTQADKKQSKAYDDKA
jgi:hypothetical protein